MGTTVGTTLTIVGGIISIPTAATVAMNTITVVSMEEEVMGSTAMTITTKTMDTMKETTGTTTTMCTMIMSMSVAVGVVKKE